MNNKNIAKLVVGVGGFLFVLSWFKRPKAATVATVTTSEGFDLSAYGGPTTYPQAIKTFAQAIAKQEGFYTPGSIPKRAHNPGDLKIPGKGTLPGTSITLFDDDDSGWDALYHQLMLIVTGQSGRYDLDMTIADMAAVWTLTQQGPWAANVSAYIGASPSTPLWQVLV